MINDVKHDAKILNIILSDLTPNTREKASATKTITLSTAPLLNTSTNVL